MSPLRGGRGGLQPGRSAADHHHPPAADGGFGQQDRFLTRARVDDAAEPPAQPHPSDAFLIARQARSDVVRFAGQRLRREVRVRDLAAHHPDQVAVPLVESPVGLMRIREPADTDHRKSDPLPDGIGDEQRVPARDGHGRLDHVQRLGGHADGRVEVVDPPVRLE
jgi:hypothetical protein